MYSSFLLHSSEEESPDCEYDSSDDKHEYVSIYSVDEKPVCSIHHDDCFEHPAKRQRTEVIETPNLDDIEPDIKLVLLKEPSLSVFIVKKKQTLRPRVAVPFYTFKLQGPCKNVSFPVRLFAKYDSATVKDDLQLEGHTIFHAPAEVEVFPILKMTRKILVRIHFYLIDNNNKFLDEVFSQPSVVVTHYNQRYGAAFQMLGAERLYKDLRSRTWMDVKEWLEFVVNTFPPHFRMHQRLNLDIDVLRQKYVPDCCIFNVTDIMYRNIALAATDMIAEDCKQKWKAFKV